VAVLDILKNCLGLQARAHRSGLLVAGALLASAGGEVGALRAGLTVNILWAPTNLARALALLATVGPWLALTMWIVVRRRAARRA
jgi:hypothetical protein